MKERLVRQLISLYPPAWRVRYRDEFQAFLEVHPSNVRTVFNVIAWAMYERVLSLVRLEMDGRQQSLALMSYAYLGAMAAGLNFYWTVADTPLAAAMHTHFTLLTSWNVARVGSLLALAAVVMVGAPVLVTMVRSAVAARRWNVLYWLAVPPCAVLVAVGWIITATILSGGHWAPTPWDVTGDWTAPHDWPPLGTRWVLSSVTFVLMTAGLIASAIGIRQAIHQTDLSKYRGLWFTAASILLAGSVAAMALGVLTWGWFVQEHAASPFHTRNGGLFNSTNFASWAASCVLLLLATVVAIQGARSALVLTAE
jgi:hypothetical protein